MLVLCSHVFVAAMDLCLASLPRKIDNCGSSTNVSHWAQLMNETGKAISSLTQVKEGHTRHRTSEIKLPGHEFVQKLSKVVTCCDALMNV